MAIDIYKNLASLAQNQIQIIAVKAFSKLVSSSLSIQQISVFTGDNGQYWKFNSKVKYDIQIQNINTKCNNKTWTSTLEAAMNFKFKV